MIRVSGLGYISRVAFVNFGMLPAYSVSLYARLTPRLQYRPANGSRCAFVALAMENGFRRRVY